ncbi:MAG: hypothetical protein WBD99_08130 [Thermodesulfobacteriota bacterium]
MDKLSYYDVLSNLLPGLVFVWALGVLGPFTKGTIQLLLTGNTIVDSIIFVALGYVAGHILQFISRYSIEQILKRIFWKGNFFSDIFLVSAFKQCPQVELRRYIAIAENKLGFSRDDLGVLCDPDVTSNQSKKEKAISLSRAIYRAIDAKTSGLSRAHKAHIQNTFYSLFRNLSVVFLILGLSDLLAIILHFVPLSKKMTFLIVVNFAISVIFFIRAKQRGELYVRSLFWSYI